MLGNLSCWVQFRPVVVHRDLIIYWPSAGSRVRGKKWTGELLKGSRDIILHLSVAQQHAKQFIRHGCMLHLVAC